MQTDKRHGDQPAVERRHCDFCYKDAFYEGGRSFYTQRVDAALTEISRLPGRHLYFLAAGWKKFEFLWNAIIRARQLRVMTPLLEAVLSNVSGLCGSKEIRNPAVSIRNTAPHNSLPSSINEPTLR